MKTRKTENLPGTKCDICGAEKLTTIIDAPTKTGPWAHMCITCFKHNGREPATKFIYRKRSDREYSLEEEREHADKLTEDEIGAILFDGDCETIDGCVVEPDGMCPHGYKSPLLILGVI
jgi:hypothetical protein